jgi:transcriptional regulator GlxA family with amidase domain
MTNGSATATVAEYLSLDELATYSGFSRRQLERFLHHAVNPLPHYKFGADRVSRQAVRVRRSDYDAWVQQFRRGQSPIDVDAHIDAKIRGEK